MSFAAFWKKRFGKTGPRFQTRLREAREAQGITVGELAEHCQVSRETIELIETTRYEPSVVLAEHFATRLGSTVEELFTALPAVAPRNASGEERIRLELGRVGLWCFYGLLFLSLIIANILFQIDENSFGGLWLGIIWFVGCVAFLTSAYGIQGYWTYNRIRLRNTSSNRVFWARVILPPIGYALLMVLLVDSDKSWWGKVASFFFYALVWGGMMYWLLYRKVKRTPN